MPVHNRSAVTERIIDCLVAQTYTNYQLILIDDGSTDNTVQMVQAKIKNVVVLRGKGDWWWAGSLQQGINWLKQHGAGEQDIVMFANDDITFAPDFLQKAAAILAGHEATLLLPHLINEKTGLPEETGVEADMHRLTFAMATSANKINCLSTRGLFMRMADLRRIGGFHPWLLPHYWSDYEFTMRAHRKGLKLITSAEIAVNLDREQTGYRNFSEVAFLGLLKKYFSKRSVLNPIYHSSFVLLVGTWCEMPHNLYVIWRDSFAYLKGNFRRSLSKWQESRHMVKAIRRSRSNLRVIVGSAATRQEGWISTDYPLLDLANERTFARLFRRCSIDRMLAEHVWEHLSSKDAAEACTNCYTYLKQGGVLRIAVPDGFHSDADYLAQVRPGGYGPGADDHKVLYDYRTLSALLEKAGFKVRLLEWFDEQGAFHHEAWNADEGMIRRSTRFDARNQENPTTYTSLIVDAIKP